MDVAPTNARMKFEAELYAKRIDSGEQEHACLDMGSEFGKHLSTCLRRSGWAEATRHSACKVATFEDFLEKNGRQVHITSSVFLGPFTLVETANS